MTLLPPNASRLERTLDLVEAAREVDVEAIGRQLDPWRCPASLLGYLAWSLSVDLWDDGWPELKKRQVCARSFEHHRLKGTIAGVRAHLALVGAELVRARRPRDRTFLVGRSDPAEMLSSLPQLRVYPFLDQAIARRRSFFGSPAHHATRSSLDADGWDFSSTGPTFDASGGFFDLLVPRPIGRRPLGMRGVWRPSRGAELTGVRTTIVDAGIERDVVREQLADGAFRVLARSSTRRRWHGVGFARGFLTPSLAATASYALRIDPSAATLAVQPGQDIVAVKPTRVYVGRTAPRARAFHGRRGRAFLLASHAPFLVYDQVPLYTAVRLAARQRRRAWYGVGRRGQLPFTAELTVDVPMHRPRSRSNRWHSVGFAAAADMTPVARALEAIRVSKALRDTILVDTTIHRPVQFGDGLQFGDFRFGEIRKAA